MEFRILGAARAARQLLDAATKKPKSVCNRADKRVR
jgi:hypothetical protein